VEDLVELASLAEQYLLPALAAACDKAIAPRVTPPIALPLLAHATELCAGDGADGGGGRAAGGALPAPPPLLLWRTARAAARCCLTRLGEVACVRAMWCAPRWRRRVCDVGARRTRHLGARRA
jgi:hypothetical protein